MTFKRYAFISLVIWLPLSASAGIFDDDGARRAIVVLQNKAEAITRELNLLAAKVDTKSDKSTALDMLNQREQTNQGIARLYGQLEELKHELEMARKDQKSLFTDLDARLKKLEPQQQTIDGRVIEVMPGEQQDFDVAWNLFQSGDYKNASSAFADFIKRYPHSAHSANAHYWLGNAYYALSNYKGAIAAQEAVMETYKDSAKAPDAMLSIASSYTGLKDKKAASNTLRQLIRTFPNSPAAQTAKARLAALK